MVSPITREQREQRRVELSAYGAEVRARRLALGKSLNDLAAVVGYRAATLSQIENGKLESVSTRMKEMVNKCLMELEK
jgi:transcriptional regulator with XRE-family HTH domain